MFTPEVDLPPLILTSFCRRERARIYNRREKIPYGTIMTAMGKALQGKGPPDLHYSVHSSWVPVVSFCVY